MTERIQLGQMMHGRSVMKSVLFSFLWGREGWADIRDSGLLLKYAEEETKRKIRMHLASTFLPVTQVDTGDSLLEAGTTGIENGEEKKLKIQMKSYKNS
ncbi:hypothetical protein T4D_5967 [Trichinella pseudospiralis]|uniref:Uncharacterized protein n=1 Tax=Trichinella pseudospiralis TaxID=6337 RepID=A0A0V1F5P2_TRIPS|nr:hypothetical protein T4D_5967 [Trichinella pseudospiralis]